MLEKAILGKTGIEITRFGFGGIPIQRVDERQAVETVLHAVERGVDFIDTARSYTTSESRIGIALKEVEKTVVLASKSPQRSADGMRKDIETSLKNLGRDVIDLYQCHFVKDREAYREITSKGGALEALQKARDEGLIRHIGITSHSLDLLDYAIDDGLFETLMVCYSFLEPKAEEKVIPKALAKDMGVIAMKSLSGGVIENCRLAIKYALAMKGTIIIPGVESKELFDRNWDVFLEGGIVTDEETEEIRAFREQFGKQFCRRCDYCQPCPEEIQIQMVLGIKSIVKRMGPAILKGGRQKDAVDQARNCTACGQCMERCPYDLPIPDLIQENIKWFDAQSR